MQKFTHLRSCLSGTALSSILGIPCTEEHYQSTYEQLEKRFGQPSLLVSLHTQNIVNLPQIPDGDLALFRRTLDAFSISYREVGLMWADMLQKSGKPFAEGAFDLILVPLLMQKLPPAVRME